MDAGIIMPGERSAYVTELSEALRELGLAREATDCLTIEVLDALNTYRIANALPELDFADPAALRALGISCGGDEVMALARYGAAHGETEIEIFDACRAAVEACRDHGLTIHEYTKMSGAADVSAASVTAALLALLY